MSVAEMKSKITDELENLNERQLSFILNIIDEIKTKTGFMKMSMESVFEYMKSKYGNTLKKLAE